MIFFLLKKILHLFYVFFFIIIIHLIIIASERKIRSWNFRTENTDRDGTIRKIPIETEQYVIQYIIRVEYILQT
ncbi:unnamed protein product [Rhizophagus irregularis]|uniref:Uncharacterized protein n=1 Tax=Rhizophagus irregularis TaxID=588596 RepID=A0A915ZJN9_9GLOM|nr:unnamed protein product [Rhizophagus irregularis]